MAEYIEREAIRNALYDEDAITISGIVIINRFPSADVVPVKHGKWIDLWVEDDEMPSGGFFISQCSICKEESPLWGGLKFCLNCGAAMEIDRNRVLYPKRRGDSNIVSVVRCKDCIHGNVFNNGCNSQCELSHTIFDADGYCSDGERKADG